MNFYEQPVAQTFMDTYAPLPFQELAMLGSAYKKEKDATEEALTEYKTKYGDFSTLSATDASNYDKTAFGWYDDKVAEMSSDPEKIKSQEFQSLIRNGIRSVDTKTLGKIKQSAENLKQRAQVIAKLKAEGKYKESWDPINMNTWNTADKGVMNDMSPLEYKTLHDIASPYTEVLKGQKNYLSKIDRYRYWEGVDESHIRNSLNTAYSDIFSTPQGKAWENDVANELAKQGITDPKAVKEEMMNMLVQSQKDHMTKELAYDKVALEEDAMAMKRAAAGAKNNTSNPPARYTDMIRLDGKRYLNNVVSSVPVQYSASDKAAITKASMDLQIANVKGNANEIAMAQQAYDNVQGAAQSQTLDTTIRNNFEHAIGRSLGDDKRVNYTEMVKGGRAVVDLLSSDNDLAGAQQVMSNVTNATSKKDGSLEFTMTDSRNLQNPTTVVSTLDGLGMRKHSNDFDKLLSSGAFKNLTVTPATTKGIFNYTDKAGNLKQKQKVIVTLRDTDIDLNEIKGSTATKDKRVLYGILTANGAKITDIDAGKISSSRGYDIVEGYVPEESKRTVTTSKGNGKYITFEAFVDIPDDISGSQGLAVSSINAGYNRAQMTAKDASGIYPQEQADAFYGQKGISLDNMLEE